MAPALPVGTVSWTALWQAAACHCLSICGTEIKAQGRLETQFALEVPVVVISSSNAMKVYRSPLAAVRAVQSYVGVKRDRRQLKCCPSQHARIVSPRMSVIRATTGLKEARATLEVDDIKRKSK
jgi:hypothetical protein